MISNKNLIIIGLLSSMFILTQSQNIITSWHYDKVQMYDIKRIASILTTQLMERVKDIPNFTEDKIFVSKITIKKVQTSLDDSYLDYQSGLFIFSPNKLIITFSLKYSISGLPPSACSMELSIDTLKFRLENIKESQTVKTTVIMKVIDSGFAVFDISASEYAEMLRQALIKGFANNKIVETNLAGVIDINEYYTNLYNEKKPKSFMTSSILDTKTIKVNINRFLGFCEDKKGDLKTNICYYSGELDAEDKTDKTEIPLGNPNFGVNQEEYDMFINKDLINLILKKISDEGISEKIFNENSVTYALPYDFTVKSLKTYFNGLDSYDDTLKFDTLIKLSELTSTGVKLNINFNIGEEKNIFELTVDLTFNYDFNASKNTKVNLCIQTPSVSSVAISSGSATIIDEEQLKTAIISSFNIEKKSVCLSDKGIDLNDYFTMIKNVESLTEGLYIWRTIIQLKNINSI